MLKKALTVTLLASLSSCYPQKHSQVNEVKNSTSTKPPIDCTEHLSREALVATMRSDRFSAIRLLGTPIVVEKVKEIKSNSPEIQNHAIRISLPNDQLIKFDFISETKLNDRKCDIAKIEPATALETKEIFGESSEARQGRDIDDNQGLQ